MTATTIVAGALALLMSGQTGGQSAGGAGMPGMAMPHAAVAAAASEACPATPVPLPPMLAGWAHMLPLVSSASAGAAIVLPVGTAARVQLFDAAAIDYPVKSTRPPVPRSKGGLLTLNIPEPGRYRVALGAGAWIDLVQDHAALRSAAHAHGPACSTLKKTVDFDLQPGTYTLQISGNAEPVLGVMVVHLAPL